MATINYNGMKLEEVTETQIFDPPRRCVVWDNPEDFNGHVLQEKKVVAILSKSSCFEYKVICIGAQSYRHCALLPDPPKPRRATNRELARWLAQGNGEYKEIITDHECCMTYFYYSDRGRDAELPKGIKVRKWSDTEWHEPTVDYLFGGDK